MLESSPTTSPIEEKLKLEKNGDEDKVNSTPFKQIVGSLRCLCNIKPDIGFTVGLISRYKDDPKVSHMKTARRILRYLNGTMNCGLLFPNNTCDDDAIVICYSDSYWCGDIYIIRSTTGYFSRFLEHQSHGAQGNNSCGIVFM